jgi:hypothetical protein
VQTCSLLLLIVAHRRGWVPGEAQGGDGTQSVTAFELNAARERKIDVLPLLADNSWPGDMWEDFDVARAWVKQFRAGLNQPARYFRHESDEKLPTFRTLVRDALLKHKERLLERRRPSQVALEAGDDFARARSWMVDGGSVLFVGPDVHGPELGLGRLVDALASSAEPGAGLVEGPDRTLATAAEYRERFLGSRAELLRQLASVLEGVVGRAPPQPAVQTVAKSIAVSAAKARRGRPPLVVSGSWDTRVEDCLRAEKISPDIIAHVIHSRDGCQSGKILHVRGDGAVVFCRPDQVDLEKASCLIYKILGSPALNMLESIDPDLDADTVVATESDHAQFLRSCTVPTCVVSALRDRPVLFLGYPLDSWHRRARPHDRRSAETASATAG